MRHHHAACDDGCLLTAGFTWEWKSRVFLRHVCFLMTPAMPWLSTGWLTMGLINFYPEGVIYFLFYFFFNLQSLNCVCRL